MCGLVGIIGDIGFPEKKAFNGLLLTDQARGMDGTGIITVSGHSVNTVASFKRAIPSHEFMQYSAYSNLVGNTAIKVLAGHNRHATKGDPSAHHCSHPFTHGPITMMHNGTLTSQTNLPESERFEVDSENICYALSIEEPEEVIGRLKGAFTLVWWDERDDSINFCRNSQRPLFFINSTDGTKMFWASEAWMIEGYLSQERNKANDTYEKATYAEVGVHYKVIIPKSMRFNHVLEMTADKYELYKAPVVVHNNYTRHSSALRIGTYPDAKRMTKETGVDLTDLKFWLGGFVPYKANDKTTHGTGTIVGKLAHVVPINVKIQGIQRREYEGLVKDNELLLSSSLQAILDTNNRYLTAFLTGDGTWVDYTLILTKNDLVDADVLDDPTVTDAALAVFVAPMTAETRSDYLGRVEKRRELELLADEMFVDANNSLVDWKVVEQDARNAKGCCMCKTTPVKDEFHDIVWYSKVSFICGTCLIHMH